MDALDRRWRIVVRTLGTRELIQGLAGWRRKSVRPALDPMVDLAHGASALALAAFDPHRRRPALIEAAIAGVFASWGRRIATTPL